MNANLHHIFNHNDYFSNCCFCDYITSRICPFSCFLSPIVCWGLLAHALCLAYSLLVVFSQKVLRALCHHFSICIGTFRRFSLSMCAWIYLEWFSFEPELVWEVAIRRKITAFHMTAQFLHDSRCLSVCCFCSEAYQENNRRKHTTRRS